MFERHLTLAPATAVMLLVGQNAIAAPIVEDLFPGGESGYVEDSNINGQNPGATTGFNGGWTGTNTPTYQPGTTNLEMAGVVNSGGSLVNSYTGFNQTRGVSRAIAPYAGSDTLWFSSLVQFNQAALDNTAGSHFLGFLSDALPTTSAAGSLAATWNSTMTAPNGADLNGFAWGVSAGTLKLRYQTGSDTVAEAAFDPGFPLSADTPYLIITRLDVNAEGNDILNVWLLNAAPADEASLGSPALTLATADLVSGNTDIRRLVLFSSAPLNADQGAVPSIATWDAIRMGADFDDLSVIPEPSSIGLMGLGSFFVLSRKLH